MRIFSLALVVLAGAAAVLVSGYYLFQDWAALNSAWHRWEQLTMSAADMRSLFIANARQQAFRLNCFADGVGVLLGGILAAVGVHGLCVTRALAAQKDRAASRRVPGAGRPPSYASSATAGPHAYHTE